MILSTFTEVYAWTGYKACPKVNSSCMCGDFLYSYSA